MNNTQLPEVRHSSETRSRLAIELIGNCRWYIRLFMAVVALSLGMTAKAAIVLLEGPISNLQENPGDGSGSITVMGVTVTIPAGMQITTPTAVLSIVEAANPAQLPGRVQSGFIGGTAIITGVGDIVTGYTADSVFLEPAENILGAEVTSQPGEPFKVGNVALLPTGDARIPDDPFTNVFGFEVDPSSVPAGSGAVSEGYLSNDGSGVMRYFAIEVENGTLVNAGVTEVSITRAQCIAGANPGDPIELRVQGAVHDPATGAVTISDTDNPSIIFGTEPVVVDIPPFAIYTFRLRNNPVFTVCPGSVTVDFNGVTAVAVVN